jgi:hypothetical protein
MPKMSVISMFANDPSICRRPMEFFSSRPIGEGGLPETATRLFYRDRNCRGRWTRTVPALQHHTSAS